jgi:hypothetical protein
MYGIRYCDMNMYENIYKKFSGINFKLYLFN